MIFQGIAKSFEQCRCADIRFRGAVLTGSTKAAFIHFKDHMPQFGAVRMFTFDDVVIHNDAAPQTGSQRIEQQTADVLCGTRPVLTVIRCIGIVLQNRGTL